MHPIWNAPIPGAFGPPSQAVLFEDFMNPSVTVAIAGGVVPWAITPATGTVATGTGHGGEVIVTFDTSETSIRPSVNAIETAVGRNIYFEARYQQSSLTPVGYIGLSTDGTPSNNDDAAIFWTTTVTGVLIPTVSKSNVDSTKTITNAIAAATYVTLGIKIEGLTRTLFFVDGVKVAEIASTPAAGVNIGPVIALGAAGTFTLDYVLVVSDR